MSKDTILVVGGAGYIGSHMVKMLQDRGFKVIVYDNLSTGFEELVLTDNFIKGDIANTQKLDEVFSRYNIDAVMHFAAFSLVGESMEKPQKYYKNNMVNVFNLLNRMLEHDINYFIFSSTAAVYSNPESVPIKEYFAKQPINTYGKTKLTVEELLEDYSRAYNLKYSSLRYFNAAGADESAKIGEMHDPETHLIPLVLKTALKERDKIYIFGTDYKTRDGTCIRDYIHVNDLASAHLKALERLFDGKSSEIFNLGSGNGYSVNEIIDKTKEITGIDFEVEEADRREGDPPILIADSRKAEVLLDWKREYDLDDIIKTAWEWHKKISETNL